MAKDSAAASLSTSHFSFLVFFLVYHPEVHDLLRQQVVNVRENDLEFGRLLLLLSKLLFSDMQRYPESLSIGDMVWTSIFGSRAEICDFWYISRKQLYLRERYLDLKRPRQVAINTFFCSEAT